MTQQLVPDSAAPSDPELIAAVRAGDADAYGVLFERHRSAALSLARQIAGPSDADDLVSDAFIKLLRVLQGGGGPDVAFRAYLLTAVRRLHIDRIRANARVSPSDNLEQFDPGTPFADTAVDKFENAAAAKAFASLPERWQLVLWHLEVEGQKPADVAPLLGMTPNSVSALAYRAREGLRQAYLQMHLADTGAEECRWVTERLGAYVRRGLSKRDAAKVEDHLDDCRKCTAVYLELNEVNSNLSAILGPALLGAAAAGYLGSTAGGGAAGTTTIASWLLKARHVAKAHAAMTVGGTAATVVAAGVATTLVINGLQNTADQRSDVPVAHSTVGTPTGGTGGPTAPPPPTHKPPTHKPPHKPPQHHHNPPPPVVPNPLTSPTQPAPTTPSPGPIVVSEIPNPQDDDPPADPNAPGLPPVTPPPTTPPPPPPPPADPSVTMSVTTLGDGRFVAVIDPATADPATVLMMSIDVSEWTSFDVSGWDCPQPAPGEVHVECFLTSAVPEPLTISITFPRAVRPSITATITAANYDDPDPSNNTVSWTV